MKTEHLPRNKQGRRTEPSLWVVENTDGSGSLLPGLAAPTLRDDEHGDDVHLLLEENALLRRILAKLDLVLKKVTDPR
jgi:hypothetical protein